MYIIVYVQNTDPVVFIDSYESPADMEIIGTLKQWRLTASAWVKLGVHGFSHIDNKGQNVLQDVKKNPHNLRVAMLLRTENKCHSDPTSLSRNYKNTKMVMEEGESQDGFIKSKADFW